MDGHELCTAGRFNSEIEAEMARAALKAEGIESMLKKDDCGGMRPHMILGMPVMLLVRDVDFEAAKTVLALVEDGSFELPEG